MKKVHELKTWPSLFGPVWDGVKTFDYRRNDRCYEVGDLLHMKEWDPHTEVYSGRELLFVVTYILVGGQFGIPRGDVIMSLEPPSGKFSGMWAGGT